MKSKIVLSTALLAGVMIFNSGCKKWLDVNKNPNIANDVPVSMLLTSAEVSIASGVGTYLQVNGGLWAQYWTQAPSASQYKVYEQYSPNASDYDRPWGTFYNDALMDLEALQQKARQTNARDYQAIAMLLKAYTFQVVSDAWGDVPFSEALKGRPEDGGIVSPEFDNQEDVYAGINSMIDSARAIIDELQTSNVAGDLIYGGDLGVWWKFANTLQLKVYLRLSEKSPAVAQAGVARIYGIAMDESGFLGEGEDAKIDFTTTPGNQNPLFSEISGLNSTQNIVASATVIDELLANEDYRIYHYFNDDGGFAGITQGNYNVSPSTFVSIPSPITGADANSEQSGAAPVIFMSNYESLFLQSEASARTWGTGDAQALFEAGIYASFNAHPGIIEALEIPLRNSFDITDSSDENTFLLTTDYAAYRYINGDTLTGFLFNPSTELYEPVIQSPASMWGVYPTGATVDSQVHVIVTQKWFSMTGTQGFEAWTEQRRTGYPDFFQISLNSIIGQRFPNRFLYPTTEVTRNQNFPGQGPITDKVWWDAN